MSTPTTSDSNPTPEPNNQSNEPTETTESFGQLFAEYERSHARPTGETGPRQIEGTVVTVSTDSVYVDIGYKTEGVLPLALFTDAGETIEPGAKLLVTVKGRNEEGYYTLSRHKVAQPKDWTSLEQAFTEKSIIAGTVDRKSTRLNSSHLRTSRMPSSA